MGKLKNPGLSFDLANRIVRVLLTSNGGYRSTGEKIRSREELREILKSSQEEFDMLVNLLSKIQVVVSENGSIRLGHIYHFCRKEDYVEGEVTYCSNEKARLHGIVACVGPSHCPVYKQIRPRLMQVQIFDNSSTHIVTYPFKEDLYPD